jgi:hypothetical protein
MVRPGFLPIAIAVALITVALIATPARAGDDSYSYARVVRLSYVDGDVQIVRPDGSSKWEPAFANMPIEQGFTLGTNDGRAEVEFEHGSVVWLAANSVIQFTELALSDGGRITKMMLARGTATFDADLAAGDKFAVSTAHFDITPPDKSEFRVDAFKDGGSVSVFKGRVSVVSGDKSKDVSKGETLAVKSGALDLNAVQQNPARDSWDKWVGNRESVLVNGQSQSLLYTNPPFTYGMADLASYGAWNSIPGCGYGWQPFGMSAGWMPFMYGQWIDYPGFGWTWVSSEPWGWTPYHFGNWMSCPGFGWAWMPGGYGFWSPAPVQWLGVGGGIGWRPLPPPVHVHPVPVATPVVVSSKALGKNGNIQVLSANKVGSDLEIRSTAPLSNGRFAKADVSPDTSGAAGVKGASAPTVVVPTSANLGTLRSALPVSTSQARVTNSAPLQNTLPNRVVTNIAPPAPRVPSAPPVRTTTYTQPSYGHPGYSTSSGSRGVSPPPAPMPSSAPAPWRAPAGPAPAPHH